MNLIYCILIIILNLALINANQLSINPSELFINGTIEKENCNELKISYESSGNIIGESKWSFTNSREIKDYTIDSQYLGLIEKYPKKIYFKDRDTKTVDICFDGEKPGSYNGILVYKTESGLAGIGIWIHLKLENKIKNKIFILYLTPTLYLFIILILLRINKTSKNL
ncbi:Uncharacterised protein [uncultured archaeon]|nr:Uncharacterised protein [uncultured archaeon]